MNLQATGYRLQATGYRLQAKNSLKLAAWSLKHDAGLTLMEVLVTVSILTLVFGMTFGAMRIYDISISMGSTKSNLSAQATQALNKMREELSQSSRLQIIARTDNPSGGNPPTPDDITFRIAYGLDSQQDIEWGDDTTKDNQIKYYVDPDGTRGGRVPSPANPKLNQLVRETSRPPAIAFISESVLANDIYDLQLTNNAADSQFTLPFPSGINYITIHITANKPIQRGIVPALSVTMSTRVDFKN